MSQASNLSAPTGFVYAARLAGVYAVAYFCADRALDFVAFNKGWSIFWPLNGVTIALLVMRRRADWPAMLFGITLGTGMGELFNNTLLSEALQRFFSLTEVTLCALILPAFTTLDEWLRKPHVYRKFCTALLLGPGISGIMAALWWHHSVAEPYLNAFNDWATADALGIAFTIPLALSLQSEEMRCLFKKSALPRTLGVLGLTLAVCLLIFVGLPFSLLFLVYPALLLVDSTLGFAGSAIAMPMACLLAVYGETTSRGPFGHLVPNSIFSPEVMLQAFLGFQALALFPASVQFRQRRLLDEELRQTNAQLATLASLDGLTSIPNRRSLDEHFAAEWGKAARARQPLNLLMIDIDHFKQFNDLYGHHAGDACLKNVASVLSALLRRPRDMAARFGGEEFAVLLPDTPEEGVRAFAQRIFLAIQAVDIPHEASDWGRITVSVGCAARTAEQIDTHQELLKLADAALYKAKRAGRNGTHFNFPERPTPSSANHAIPLAMPVITDSAS